MWGVWKCCVIVENQTISDKNEKALSGANFYGFYQWKSVSKLHFISLPLLKKQLCYPSTGPVSSMHSPSEQIINLVSPIVKIKCSEFLFLLLWRFYYQLFRNYYLYLKRTTSWNFFEKKNTFKNQKYFIGVYAGFVLRICVKN